MEKIKDSLVGVVGFGASAGIEHVVALSQADIKNIVEIVVQVIIGLATIYTMFKRPKKNLIAE